MEGIKRLHLETYKDNSKLFWIKTLLLLCDQILALPKILPLGESEDSKSKSENQETT